MKVIQHIADVRSLPEPDTSTTERSFRGRLDGRVERGEFNGGEHLFLELAPTGTQTISVRLPDGAGFVTVCFIPSSKRGEFECVDIHSTVGQVITAPDGRKFREQHLIGFTCGRNVFDTRTDEAKDSCTLATLLLAKHHHSTAPKGIRA